MHRPKIIPESVGPREPLHQSGDPRLHPDLVTPTPIFNPTIVYFDTDTVRKVGKVFGESDIFEKKNKNKTFA